MDNRIIVIRNKKTNETIRVTWLESLRYIEGLASFEEYKEKYGGKIDENKKSGK